MRSILVLLFALLICPASQSHAQEGGTFTARQVPEWEARNGQHENAVRCPELVELTASEDRMRKLVDSWLFELASLTQLAFCRPASHADDDGPNDRGVVQSFRAAGVRLLLFGTAPPVVMNR